MKKVRDIILAFFPLRFLVGAASLVRSGYDKLVFFDRILIANRYLRGEGIEIGALHAPLVVPPGAKVRYVDRMSVQRLREQYPELKKYDLVEVDIEDDGELLETLTDASQDFVIANHFLEHGENPILALLNMFRVLKSGGILYLALPDKRCTFDAERPVTEFSHLLKDYEEGAESSRLAHYREWAKFVSHARGEEDIEAQAVSLMEKKYSIHFHVWTQKEMIEMLGNFSQRFGINFDFELFFKRGRECIFVLRKA